MTISDPVYKKIPFRSPLMTASGTFSSEYLRFYKDNPFSCIVTKTYTVAERHGNKGIRVHEIPCGMLNSVGLANPGIEKMNLDDLKKNDIPVMVSCAMLEIKEINVFKKVLLENSISLIELNLSCPNIMGKPVIADLSEIKDILIRIRSVLKDIFISAKLSSVQISEKNIILLEKIGFDSITVMNTLPALDIDIENMSFIFENISCGMSGYPLMPICLKAIFDIKRYSNIPVIACGGVRDYRDVLKYILVGAHFVQIGSSIFSDPLLPVTIMKDLGEFKKRKKIKDLKLLRGKLNDK